MTKTKRDIRAIWSPHTAEAVTAANLRFNALRVSVLFKRQNLYHAADMPRTA